MLIQYIIAATQLYGLIQINKVIEIYNSQNAEKISQTEMDELIKNSEEELNKNFVYIQGSYFVIETIIQFDEVELYIKKKADKPYYIPSREELLKYTDDFYFEKTKEYDDLLKYIEKNFISGEEAELIAEDIQGLCHVGADLQRTLNEFSRRNIQFKGEKQVNEVLALISNLSNNTRIWENNGHTPNEIFNIFEKPNLIPLPDKPFEFSNPTSSKRKIGRNEPCPCKSGKKYKKCCLGKVIWDGFDTEAEND